jgi:predicted dehydrogenase
MNSELKIAVIGLDTSHSVEFVKHLQSPDCPPEQKVEGMRAVTCMRFETPFQNKEGLDKRQQTLEGWGVKVTESFAEAVKGCDAILLEINDPAFHLEYVKKVVRLKKPVFIDKPLASTFKEGVKILALLKKHGIRAMSCSSLRFAVELEQALAAVPQPQVVNVTGAYGKAPAGDSLIWYGVHAFEMLQRAMGRGAVQITATETEAGVVAIVDYPNGRQGVVEVRPFWHYCGRLMTKEKIEQFKVDTGKIYAAQMRAVGAFLHGGEAPLAMEDALEVLAMMETARKSITKRKTVAVPAIA